MADDVQIADTSSGDAPHDYIVPSSADFILKAAYGVFDGTSASGNFLPALEIVSDSGHTVARSVGTSVTAGDSAEVSWFPFAPPVSSGGGSLSVVCKYEVLQGDQIIDLTPGSSYTFKADTFDGGWTLLDLSNVNHPAVLVDGAYQVSAVMSVSGDLTTDACFVKLEVNQQVNDDGSPSAITSSVTGYFPGSSIGAAAMECVFTGPVLPMLAGSTFGFTVLNWGANNCTPSLDLVTVSLIAAG